MKEQLKKIKLAQIELPDPGEKDPHPRLLVDGYGIHAGACFTALFPDGWRDICLEVDWDTTGPACWYISTPGMEDICPIGLFVKMR